MVFIPFLLFMNSLKTLFNLTDNKNLFKILFSTKCLLISFKILYPFRVILFYCIIECLLILDLLPQSKKIRKRKNEKSPSEELFSTPEYSQSNEGENEGMHYCIFTNEEKKHVLHLMKEYLIEKLGLSIAKKDSIKSDAWLEFIEQIGNDEFISFIKKYIPLFVNYKKVLLF